jgi:hypothetical protein
MCLGYILGNFSHKLIWQPLLITTNGFLGNFGRFFAQTHQATLVYNDKWLFGQFWAFFRTNSSGNPGSERQIAFGQFWAFFSHKLIWQPWFRTTNGFWAILGVFFAQTHLATLVQNDKWLFTASLEMSASAKHLRLD